MEKYSEFFQNEKELEEAISRPSLEVIKMMKKLEGDIIFLGVSGKMGISMACMAKRACELAGIEKRIIGVSRFSVSTNRDYLESNGIETISGDLIDQEFIKSLPNVSNVIYLAGTKFGTNGNESYTWAMNTFLPGLVVERYKDSKIVALSTGCVYPLVPINSNGSLETDPALPVGEYAQSCLGRERMFEFGSVKYKTKVSLIRLNYAVEMRYGVLVDIATKVKSNQPIDVTMGYANVIWQGVANEMILRSLPHCESPAKILNITGENTISVRDIALRFGSIMGKEVTIIGKEGESALLSNASLSVELFGKPKIHLDQIISWTANWIDNEHRLLGKPTHFEVKDGKY